MSLYSVFLGPHLVSWRAPNAEMCQIYKKCPQPQTFGFLYLYHFLLLKQFKTTDLNNVLLSMFTIFCDGLYHTKVHINWLPLQSFY